MQLEHSRHSPISLHFSMYPCLQWCSGRRRSSSVCQAARAWHSFTVMREAKHVHLPYCTPHVELLKPTGCSAAHAPWEAAFLAAAANAACTSKVSGICIMALSYTFACTSTLMEMTMMTMTLAAVLNSTCNIAKVPCHICISARGPQQRASDGRVAACSILSSSMLLYIV